MPVDFVTTNQDLKVFFDTGKLLAHVGMRVRGTGPFIVALHSSWLGSSLHIEAFGDCDVHKAEDAKATLKAAQDSLVTKLGIQKVGVPHLNLKDHVIIALPKKQAEFRVVIDTSSPRLKELESGSSKQVRIESKVVDLGASGASAADIIPWQTGSSFTVSLDVRGKVSIYRKSFAIDVGTTNTCAAFMVGEPPSPELFHYAGKPSIPTLVLYNRVGQDGKRDYKIGPRVADAVGRAIPVRSIKRYLGAVDQQRIVKVVDGTGETSQVRVGQVYFDFVSKYLDQFQADRKVKLRQLKATYPPFFPARALQTMAWTYEQLHINCTREKLLGVDEASAAALWYVWRNLQLNDFSVQRYNANFGTDHNMLVFDLGGGTTDIALVTSSVTEKEVDGRKRGHLLFEVKNSHSIPDIGGDNFTLEVFRALKCRLTFAAALHHKGGQAMGTPNTKDSLAALDEMWEKQDSFKAMLGGELESDESSGLRDRLETLAEKVLPTAWARIEEDLSTPEPSFEIWDIGRAMNTFHVLWDIAESVKVTMSKSEHVPLDPAELSIGGERYESIEQLNLDTAVIENIVMDRQVDLEDRIRPLVKEAVEGCRRTLRTREGQEQRVESIQLVGNSCRIPLVRKLLIEEFQDWPLIEEIVEHREDEAKTAVALGSCLAFHVQSYKGIPGIEIEFKNVELDLGVDVGLWDGTSPTTFEPLFRASDRPSDRPSQTIPDDNRMEVVLYRRPADKIQTKPVFFGKFLLDDGLELPPHLEPAQQGQLRLILIGQNNVALVRGRLLYRFKIKGIVISPAADPFSGIH